MERLLFFLLASALTLGLTSGAPWVFLDDDMLAMSSEVSDSVSILPPPRPPTVEDDREVQLPKTEENEEVPTTKKSIKDPEPYTTISIVKSSVRVVKNEKETIPIPIPTTTTESQTTEKVTESTTVGASMETYLKQEGIQLQVLPEPPTFPETHPNSIEDDISIEPFFVIGKRRYHRKQFVF